MFSITLTKKLSGVRPLEIIVYQIIWDCKRFYGKTDKVSKISKLHIKQILFC
jgi:hypothetical protein